MKPLFAHMFHCILAVRRPVSPIAGLKHEFDRVSVIVGIGQKACKPDRGIETPLENKVMIV